MITPIIIPPRISRPRCRECGCDGSCRCDPVPMWLWFVVPLGILFASWVIFTLMEWMLPDYHGEYKTLVQVLVSQWEWLTGLRIW